MSNTASDEVQRPRRSLLYMPGANARALQKARRLACDTILFDLEDAVSPDSKLLAREQVVTSILQGGYGHRELVVRVNGLDTAWGQDDVAAVAELPIDAILFPKIETRDQLEEILRVVDGSGGPEVAVWVMVETPRGVMDLEKFADHPRLQALVLGTSDLVKELRARHTSERHNIGFALQRCVMVARMFGKEVFDGVHLDFKNEASFLEACERAREIGFDGKTLIHPSQIEGANAAFGYSLDQVEHAHRLLAVWREATEQGLGVAVLDGQLVENLHAAEARRVVDFAEAIANRPGADLD